MRFRRSQLLRCCLVAGLACITPAQAEEVGACPMPPLGADLPAPPGGEQLELTADQATWQQNGLGLLKGAVRLALGESQFSTEALDFDEQTRQVKIDGPSLFGNPRFVISSESAEFDLDDETGSFFDTEFLLKERAAHGGADHIEISSAGVAQLEDVSYTTCEPDHEVWELHASRIKLDHNTGRGSARGAYLRFAGVPLFWAPYFQFPIDDKRHTGLLFPLVGNSSTTGFDMRWPVYFNIAPNYDARFTPRLMSERGLQLGSDLRWLWNWGRGEARYEHLDEDKFTHERRNYFDFEQVGLLSERLGVDLAFAEVSDAGYFEDFGGDLDLSSVTHLERAGRVIYDVPASYTIQALVSDFQTISRSIATADEPYRRLPQVRLDALTRNSWHDLRAGVDAEYTNFAREDVVEGQRFDLRPYLRFLRDRNAWYVLSQADWQYTQYQLRDITPGADGQPDRQLPLFSAEGGLRFERLTGSGSLQTLEPRLFYLYVPFREQNDLPVFDTGEPDFDFVQLFARNRFSGEDRVSDANHAAAALTTRWLDPESGLTRFTGSIGQLFRFDAPVVTLPDDPAPTQGLTDTIASVGWRIDQHWSLAGTTQWSPEVNRFVRSGAAVRFRGSDTLGDLHYRFRRGVLEQADASLRTRLWTNWKLAGRVRYSIPDTRSLESLAGIEYESCCWGAQLSWRRYISNSSGEYSSGIYLLLELKGLARIGSDYAALLPATD